MPNPLEGNEEAAQYVAYYASPSMQQQTVNRLYAGGIRRQEEARKRAESEVYPPPRHAARRTSAEIEAYLDTRVRQDLFRRQMRLAELERELYPTQQHSAAPTRTTASGLEVRRKFTSKADLDKHIRRVYADEVRRRAKRQSELEERYGPFCCTTEEHHNLDRGRQRHGDAGLTRSQPQWRTPSFKVRHPDDAKALLCAVTDDCHLTPSRSPGETPRRAGRPVNEAYLARLARPVSPQPRFEKPPPTYPAFVTSLKSPATARRPA